MLKCKICGTEFPAIKERHYIARDNIRTGAFTSISNEEEKIYDAYECPMCGSQIIAQERKRNFEPDNICDFSEDDGADRGEKDA